MVKKQSQPSSLIIALAVPALILTAYATYTRLYPGETAKQIARLEEDLEQVKSAQVPPTQARAIADQLSTTREKVSTAKSDLDALRREAARMMRGAIDGNRQLQIEQAVNRVFSVAGVRLVNESSLGDRRQTPNLMKTLAEATESLGDKLTDLSSDEASSVPITVPADLPLEVNPIEWMAAQRALRVGKFDGPDTRWSELKLVGDYRSMVAGLEAVVDSCPEVIVSNIAFEKPGVRSAGPAPLIWNVQLEMRPSAIASGELETARTILDSGALAEGSRLQTRDGGEIYTVARPVLEAGE